MHDVPESADPPSGAVGLDPETIFDVQDGILAACTDLQRLVTLIAEACTEVNAQFQVACDLIDARRLACPDEKEFLDVLSRHMMRAIVALQIDDLASQLVGHTRRVLRHSADQLAAGAFDDGDADEVVIEPSPRRPSPVAQAGMDAGSIDLF